MSNPKRLLFITERFAPDLGGVARSATRTAHAIARLGYEVEVLAWTKLQQAGELSSQTVESSSPHQSTSRIQWHRLGLFSNWDLSLQHTTNILQWLHDRQPYDAVWGHYVYPAGFLGVMFAETNGLASIVSARGNDIDRLMFPPGDFARLTWTLERATAITAVSNDLAHKIDVLLNSKERAQVVHNSVDLNLFQAAPPDPQLRRSLGIDDQDVVLGFCGEMRHKKGLPFLLDCLDQVNRNRSARLLVIGAVRPREQAQLSTYFIGHPEIEDRIIATGVIDEPAIVCKHLRLCDLILIPSIWEGLPNALLEGMSCGLIAIASDAGGIPEVIDHGQDGFILPKSQLNRLGDAVAETLSQPESVLQPIRRAAREKVERNFNEHLESQRLQKVLSDAFEK